MRLKSLQPAELGCKVPAARSSVTYNNYTYLVFSEMAPRTKRVHFFINAVIEQRVVVVRIAIALLVGRKRMVTMRTVPTLNPAH